MSRKGLAASLAGMVAVVALFVIILSGGGGGDGRGDVKSTSETSDASGDVTVGEGDDPPRNPERAEIVDAGVARRGGQLVFDARLGGRVKSVTGRESLDVVWEVIEDEKPTWTLSVNLDVGPTATLLTSKGNFAISTLDGRFPGKLEISGDRITVELRPGDIDPKDARFPETFVWLLRTRLDGLAGDPGSAVAEDRLPDTGFAEVKG